MAGRGRVPKTAPEPVAPEEKGVRQSSRGRGSQESTGTQSVRSGHEGECKEIDQDGRRPLSLLGMARKVLETASSWSKAQGILARVLWASSRGEKTQVKEDPGQREREAAKKLLLLASSESVQKALEAGTLLSLGAQYKGGMVVVSGRAKKATLARLLGL